MKFYEWSKIYGPIYQMEIFGTQHVWISSEQIAHDLLSKKNTIYSDRPVIPNLPDNRTSGDYLALLGRTGESRQTPDIEYMGLTDLNNNRNLEASTQALPSLDDHQQPVLSAWLPRPRA